MATIKRFGVDTGLTSTELEAIVREMELAGYKIENANDPVFYWYLGSKTYETMIKSTFDYACIEAEHLKHPVGQQEWIDIYHIRKQEMWEAMYVNFPNLKKQDFSKLRFEPIAESEMRAHVEKKYRRNGR